MGNTYQRIVGLTAGLFLLSGLLVFCFISTGHSPALHGIKIAAVGPPRVVATLQGEFDRHAPGSITLVPYASASAAHAAIVQRDVYAAIVATKLPAQLTVASAASAVVATALTGAFTTAFAHAHLPLRVIDAVPLPPGDPRGVSILLLVVPTAITSLIYAVALHLLFRDLRLAPLVISVAGFAVLVGLAAAIVSDNALGAMAGHFGAVWFGTSMFSLALAMATTGLLCLFGLAGAGIGALLMLIGIACSGAATAPEMLPAGWRQLSPALPAGSAATFLRNLIYFDGAAIGLSALVLSLYVAAGTVALVVGRLARPGERGPGAARSAAGRPADIPA